MSDHDFCQPCSDFSAIVHNLEIDREKDVVTDLCIPVRLVQNENGRYLILYIRPMVKYGVMKAVHLPVSEERFDSLVDHVLSSDAYKSYVDKGSLERIREKAERYRYGFASWDELVKEFREEGDTVID